MPKMALLLSVTAKITIAETRGGGEGTTKGAIFRKRILNLDAHLLSGKVNKRYLG